MTLIITALVWLSGIVFADQTPTQWWIYSALTILLGFGAFTFRHRLKAKAFLIYAMIFTLGAAYHTGTSTAREPGEVIYWIDQGPVEIIGTVENYPTYRDGRTSFIVMTEMIESEKISEPILVYVYQADTFHYGDLVRLYGELKTPPDYPDFSYSDYLARQDVHAILPHTFSEINGYSAAHPLKAALFDLRGRMEVQIPKLLPEPGASLLAGILLGIESGISDSTRDAFNVTGTTHIIAISGANMIVVSAIFLAIFKRLMDEKKASILAIMGLAIYAVFTGGDPAVLRAAVMMILVLLAPLVGRESSGLVSLAFAAIVLTLIDTDVIWSLSFQLSFLASLGLILFVRPSAEMTAKWLIRKVTSERLRKIYGSILEIILVTVSAQLWVQPLLLLKTGQFSLISLPANLLIAPLQGPVMILGLIGVILSFVIFPLGQVISWGANLFLSLSVLIIRLLAEIPLASIKVSAPDIATLLAYYTLLVIAAYLLAPTERLRKRRWLKLGEFLPAKAVMGAGLLTLALLINALISLPDNRLHLFFVGQEPGTTILITPSGRSALINPAGSAREIKTALGRALPFWARTIDLVILTDTRDSQLTLLTDIQQRYEVSQIVIVAQVEDLPPQWLSSINDDGNGNRVLVSDGYTIQVEDATAISFISFDGYEASSVPRIAYENGYFQLGWGGDDGQLADPLVCQATLIELTASELSELEDSIDQCSAQFYLLPELASGLPDDGEVGSNRILRSDLTEIITDGARVWIRS